MLLIFVEVRNHVHPSAKLLKATNQAEQTGMYVTMVALVLLGCWLVYSGVKPVWRKTFRS